MRDPIGGGDLSVSSKHSTIHFIPFDLESETVSTIVTVDNISQYPTAPTLSLPYLPVATAKY